MSPDYKPSQVVLAAHAPLCNTMKKAEVEFAASLVVAASVHLGDAWSPLEPQQIGRAIAELIERKIEPWDSLKTNPFFRPDLQALIASDFAEVDANNAISFTEVGYEALRRWVRKA